jgi:hypothetical protein
MNDADEHLMTVFSDALDCGTTGEREAFLDRACGGVPGLRERVGALLRAHDRGGNFLGGPAVHPTTTAEFEPASVPGPSASGRAFDEELRRLLRSRLILVHLLALAFVVLLVVMTLLIPNGEQDAVLQPGRGYWWRLGVSFAESLIGALVLCAGRGRRSGPCDCGN